MCMDWSSSQYHHVHIMINKMYIMFESHSKEPMNYHDYIYMYKHWGCRCIKLSGGLMVEYTNKRPKL